MSNEKKVIQALDDAMKEIEIQRIKKPVNPYRRGFTDGLAVAWLSLYVAKAKILDNAPEEE